VLLWGQDPSTPASDPVDDDTPVTRIVRIVGSRHGDATSDAAIGDVLQVAVAGGTHGELRIYRDDREVVLRCPGQAGCTREPGRLSAELPLTGPGRYRAVYLLTRSPGHAEDPALSRSKGVVQNHGSMRYEVQQPRSTTGTLEGDLAACGCASRAAVPIVVR